MAVESMHADIGASIEKRATGVQASGFLGKSDGTLEDVALIALLCARSPGELIRRDFAST